MLEQWNGPQRSAIARSLVLCLLMVASVVLAIVMTPTAKVSAGQPVVQLAQLVPAAFGDWREDAESNTGVVNPQTEAAIAKIYTETLSRTYINSAGKRIMLSIAYGDDQAGESTQAHRPEICYTAQGFAITSNDVGTLDTAGRQIPVRRLVAVSGPRIEPITYWVTVGDKATLPGLGRKLTQLSYGLKGQVPDGLLFRVSSIQPDAAPAYDLQQAFVTALLSHLDPTQQARLAGKLEG